MKHYLHLFMAFALLFVCGKTQAQCPEGNVSLTSQAAVNDFAMNYPNCTEITGNLLVGGNNPTFFTDVTDLSPLSGLTSVGGNLRIQQNSDLTSLSGLDNITSVGQSLIIQSNNALTSLSGLNNINSVGISFLVTHNNALTSLSGLDNITSTSVGYQFRIYNNNSLTSLSVFSNFTSVEFNLLIQSNNSLTSLSGLDNITSVEGNFSITSNSNLISISALNNLTFVGGDFDVLGNTSLTTLQGLNNLTSVGGRFGIGNEQLTSVSALNNLVSVGAILQVSETNVLTSLSGLNNVTSVGDLYISQNNALTDISAVQGIGPETMTMGFGLYIANNPLLSVCNLPNLCTFLSNPSNPRIIHSNAGDCVSDEAILAVCSFCPEGDLIFSSQEEIDDFIANYPYCTQVVGDLVISGTDIIDLSILSNFTEINGDLIIIDNPQLTNLDDLTNLISIGGNSVNGRLNNNGGMIHIENNPLLNDISGLVNINPDTIAELKIINNPVLPVCSLNNFCSYLSNPANTHPRTINSNFEDCVSETTVMAVCALMSVYDNELSNIKIYPNPVKNILYFDKEVNKITVTDFTGKVLATQSNISQIDMSSFQSGIYLVTIEAENSIKETKKIVKE